MTAEGLMRNVFCRAFACSPDPSTEVMDQALMTELRELMPLGALTLDEGTCVEAPSIRHNVLRVHLERAVMQLPPTERLIFLLHDAESYDHARIARMLGLCEDESRYGLHQARLRIRSLVSAMSR
jgi:DNA-directed RNA polymerase specialized sigma24 family protein